MFFNLHVEWEMVTAWEKNYRNTEQVDRSLRLWFGDSCLTLISRSMSGSKFNNDMEVNNLETVMERYSLSWF